MTPLPISRAEAETLLAPLAEYDRLALAVSGGPDSLALLHLAARWHADRGEHPALTVLTVDHRLRAGSRAEAELVGRVAAELGLPHAILTWERQDVPASSVQAKARVARYDLMAAYAHANDIGAIVTAHHLDDQAETFLMRLKRGSGLDGLAAIPERGSWAGIAVLRPLLDVPKGRLIATLDDAGIAFVSDPSNLDQRFERARVRGSADALAALGLTPEALALSARRLRRARAGLDAAARDFLARHGEIKQAGYALLDREALDGAPEEIALRALAELIGAVGGSETPVRLAKLEALLQALRLDPGKAHTLGRCRIEPCSSRLGIFREVRGTGLPEARLRPGERLLWDNRFRVELGAGEARPIVVKALGEQGFRLLRKRAELASWLPRLAARTLPSCWRGDELLGVPSLGSGETRQNSGIDCHASFVSLAAGPRGERRTV
jgi:tRNA(Ile)-lysidine synthase